MNSEMKPPIYKQPILHRTIISFGGATKLLVLMGDSQIVRYIESKP